MILTSCTVDLVRGRVTRDDTSIALTTREVELLRYLAANPCRVVPRDELLRVVWGYSDAALTRASDNAIRRLRAKVEADPAHPDHVLTVHGVGYRFEPGDRPTPTAPPPAPAWEPLGAGVRIDPARRRVQRDGAPEEPLTESEAALLAALRKTAGVVDRAALGRAIWGQGRRDGRAVDQLVAKLRKKLEADPSRPAVLRTARGGGYRLETGLPEPAAVHGLVGRGRLFAEVERAHRRPGWVLLVGFAGIGKSSLARAVAPDEPWADLARASTAEEAARVIARALELSLEGDDPVQRVGLALRHRADAGLVLDNLEGVAGAAGLVDRLRELAPAARLLGTSRVRLGARGEQGVEVGPLSEAEAAEVFVRRARRVPDGREHRSDDPEVLAIVAHLDGVPLAIELAAALTAVMDVGALRERLRVGLLQQRGGGRHGHLGVVIDQALRGLRPNERDALSVLSLFASGFDVEDAEGLLGDDAVGVLGALRDHSLLRQLPTDDRTVRSGVWQSVREVLAPDVSAEAALRWCAHLARSWTPEARERLGWDGTEARTRRLFRQTGDLEGAARLALRLGDPDLAAGCAEAVVWSCQVAGPYRLGVALAEEVLAAGPGPAPYTRLLVALADLRSSAGQWDRSIDEAAEASRRAAALDDPKLELRARIRAGHLALDLRGSEVALGLYQGAVAVAERTGATDGTVSFARSMQARIERKDREEIDWLRIAIREARDAGNRPLQLRTQALLGIALRNQGELGEARALFEAVYRSAEGPLFRWARVAAANHIIPVVLLSHGSEEARRWAEAFLEQARLVGSRSGEVRARFRLVSVSHDLDELDALEQDLGATPEFDEIAAEASILRAQVLRDRGDVQGSIRAAERAAQLEPGAAPHRASVILSELAMSQLASGDVVAARATLERAPAAVGINRVHRLAQLALLGRVEGSTRNLDLSAVRAEAARTGAALPDDDEEAIVMLLGQWVPRLLEGVSRSPRGDGEP